MIKQEIDYLIKNTVDKHNFKTLCISELDYLNLCTIKKRSKMKVYKGYTIFYSDKINVGHSYLLPFTVDEINAKMFM